MKTFHIEAEEGQMVKNVVMKGDEMREKKIEEEYMREVI